MLTDCWSAWGELAIPVYCLVAMNQSHCPLIITSSSYYLHDKLKHSGVNGTLNTLMEHLDFKSRQAIKKVLRNCVICYKFSGSPYASIDPPDRPAARVFEDPPFTYTGLDFVGPLYVQYRANSVISEGNSKSYICLFTCASTQAIHLEFTLKLDIHSFLLAFQRFIAHRGLPTTLISDNATTFKSAAKEVKCIVHSKEVR